MPLDLPVTRSDTRFTVFDLFAPNNIEIAFPQQDLRIDGAISVIDEVPATIRN